MGRQNSRDGGLLDPNPPDCQPSPSWDEIEALRALYLDQQYKLGVAQLALQKYFIMHHQQAGAGGCKCDACRLAIKILKNDPGLEV